MLEKLHARRRFAACPGAHLIEVNASPKTSPASERNDDPKSKGSMPGAGHAPPSLFTPGRSPHQADMMTSSAFGSDMAMGVMAWVSRKRSSFLVSVASSTMAKCGARERLEICRA